LFVSILVDTNLGKGFVTFSLDEKVTKKSRQNEASAHKSGATPPFCQGHHTESSKMGIVELIGLESLSQLIKNLIP
jgi:hypothetical protein